MWNLWIMIKMMKHYNEFITPPQSSFLTKILVFEILGYQGRIKLACET